ncbi:MAG: hypothetical protein ACLFSQ_03420 [Candidatus Zixiibacteriota bacterium]
MLLPILAFADDILRDENYSKRLVKAIECSYRENFDRADSLLDILSQEADDSISIDFFKATVWYSKMKDAENFDEKDQLLDDMDRLQNAIGRIDSPDLKYRFIEGMISFYRALIYVDTDGSMISAAMNLRHAASELAKASEDDILRPDAYLGLGTYKFFKSSKAGFLRSVMIISDERDEGINMLRIAAKESRFGKWPAMHALALAYADLEQFEKTDSIVNVMRRLNPEGKTPLWDAIYVAEAKEDYEAVDTLAQELLNLIEEENGFNRIDVYYKMFIASKNNQENSKAEKYARAALDIKASSDAQKRQKNKIHEMEKFIASRH